MSEILDNIIKNNLNLNLIVNYQFSIVNSPYAHPHWKQPIYRRAPSRLQWENIRSRPLYCTAKYIF